jgi:GxxExxY protein
MPPNLSTGTVESSRSLILEKELSYVIVNAFYEVYNALGYGFLESLYSRAMAIALERRGLQVDREFPVPVRFLGEQIGFHRLDMLVERRVILEHKATELISDAPKRQLRSYLAATGLELGLLLHFGPKASYYRILGRSIRSNSRNSD